MKRIILFILTFFFSIQLVVFAQNNGIRFNETFNSYKIEFDLPEYSIKEIDVENQTFLKIENDAFGIIPNVGLPELPQISFNLMINSKQEKPDFEIHGIRSNTIKLEKLISDKRFLPSPSGRPLSNKTTS